MSERVEIIPSIPVENKTKIILNMTEYLLTPDQELVTYFPRKAESKFEHISTRLGINSQNSNT